MTEWSEFVFYECRNKYCQENCINHVDHQRTQLKVCRECLDTWEPVVDDLPRITHHLPDQSTASEPEGAPARPGAQRSEHPGPERERQSRSAPARPAGSDPPRVDPEGRAHPPNPEGEGGNENADTWPTGRDT